MAETTKQRRTVGRVMHEFAHGELKRSKGGKGGKVKSRRQAVAIALSEAGASNRGSPSRNARNEKRTLAKERQGRTAQQAAEGRRRVGAEGRKESSPAMRRDRYTRAELYRRAQKKRVPGRSRMSKQQLKDALGLR